MSTTLIVHKYESGGNQSLYITLDDDDSMGAIFSEWFESKNLQKKKKDGEKTARLVVKMVSGDESNNFDLDSCAKCTGSLENYNINNFSKGISSHEYNINFNTGQDNSSKKFEESFVNSYKKLISDEVTSNTSIKVIFNKNQGYQQNLDNNNILNSLDKLENSISPLEYSLEKVKENNARIMENIHMLNRTLGYTKKKEIMDIVCPKSVRSYSCTSCGKCFVYETGLRRHYSMRHAISGIQPRWQVVWTCIECFQVWPRQDLAIKHSSQCCKSFNSEFTREIKTSSLLQCEFCEKVFTSIPRLLRHSKTHTTINNYECNACEMAFLSYKTAEQHWLLCPWVKLCYTFCLPKLLLCNSCDRKFRNYDQLYNHRYKVGHFMMKSHCDNITKSLGILVYQCEICGQWFPSVPPLQAHRTQYHPQFDTGMQYQSDLDYNEPINDVYTPANNDANTNQVEESNE